MIDKSKKILIVGLGLIGGSYARGLTLKGYTVGAIDCKENVIEYATKEKIISSGRTVPEEEYIKDFDIIIFALYPKVLTEWIEKYQSFIKSGAILTDVTGIKSHIVYEVQKILRSDLEFIGAHPMAGREVYGVENSTEKIFKGANYIVTPTEKNSEAAISLCKEIGVTLGFGTIRILSPEQHDETVGFLSQLPHCIAVALMNCNDSPHLSEYSGDSFRDFTRIANINENMWCELFMMNKEALLKQLDLFINKCEELKEYIKKEEKNKLQHMMKISSERRKNF